MVDLTRTINPLGASSEIAKAMRAHMHEVHHYLPPRSDLVARLGALNGVASGQVLLADGADGALTLIALSLLRGRRIVIPLPCFPRNKDYARYANAQVTLVAPRGGIDIDEDVVLRSEGDVLLVASPNNPTGFTVTDEFLLRALERFEIVILDETLLMQPHGKEGLLREHDNLIMVRSFSKLYALAGMRIGYVLASEKHIEEIRSVSTPYKANSLAQVAALAALLDEEHTRKSEGFMRGERQRLQAALNSTNVMRSESLCYCLQLDKSQLQNLTSRGIHVQGDMGFGYGGDASVFFRLCISTPEDNDEVIEALRADAE